MLTLYDVTPCLFCCPCLQSGSFEKLNKSVRFPEVLNLAPYMSGTKDKSPFYNLYAVVVHLDIMNAAYSGHYVCYVRNLREEWFRIDDSMVNFYLPLLNELLGFILMMCVLLFDNMHTETFVSMLNISFLLMFR